MPTLLTDERRTSVPPLDVRSRSELRVSNPKLLGIRIVHYLTNYLIAHVPSYWVRHSWYRRVLGLQIAPGASIQMGCYIWFYGPGGIKRSGSRIGANTWINRGCTLDLRGGLSIGDNVSVAAGACILTSAGMANSRSAGEARRVVVEDNVWIGVRAMVMPGVTVGRGAVVSAGAVVVGDVRPLAIVFGSPARSVGARTEEEADYVLDGPPPLFE